MYSISVICPYNNKAILETALLPSIRLQDYSDYELILINTQEMGFKSAASALNYGASRSVGDILVFVHQDIELLNKNIFRKISEFCSFNDYGVAGVAGVSIKEHEVFSSVVQGNQKKQAGIAVNEVREADALDECFFFINKKNFMGFDDLGNTWHMYAVDYSLKCTLAKKKIYIVPLPVYHLSPGWSLDNSYWRTLIQVGKKYKKKLDCVPTTLGIYKLNQFFRLKVLLKKVFVQIKKERHDN